MNLQDFVSSVRQAKLGQSTLLLAFAGAEAFTLSDGKETVILSADDLREKWGESIWKTFEANFVVAKTDKQPAVELSQLPDAVAAMLAPEFNPAPNTLAAINRLSYTLVRVAQEHFGVSAAPKWDTAVSNLKTALEAAQTAPKEKENTSAPEVPVVEEPANPVQAATPAEQPLPPASAEAEVVTEKAVVALVEEVPVITVENVASVLTRLTAINTVVIQQQRTLVTAIDSLMEALKSNTLTLEEINGVYAEMRQALPEKAATEKN